MLSWQKLQYNVRRDPKAYLGGFAHHLKNNMWARRTFRMLERDLSDCAPFEARDGSEVVSLSCPEDVERLKAAGCDVTYLDTGLARRRLRNGAIVFCGFCEYELATTTWICFDARPEIDLFCPLLKYAGCAYIGDSYTDTRHCGRGIYGTVLAAACKFLACRVHRAVLTVEVGKEASRKAALKAGFEQTAMVATFTSPLHRSFRVLERTSGMAEFVSCTRATDALERLLRYRRC